MYYENSHFLIVHLLMLLYTFWNTQQWTLPAVFLHCLFNQKLFRELLHDVKQSHMPVYGECKQACITVVKYIQSQASASYWLYGTTSATPYSMHARARFFRRLVN